MTKEDSNLGGDIKRTDIVKLVGIITMLIDHIGLFLYPGIMIFRIIGRIAFPIFAYHIAVGYKNTSDINKYLIRLFIFSLISQIPYAIALDGFNIFFILFLGLLIIKLFDDRIMFLVFFIFIVALILEKTIGFSYGIYGILMPLLFYIYDDNPKMIVFVFLLMNLIYCISYGNFYQMYSLLAIPFIYYNWKIEINLNRYLFYSFYPVHIAILYVISKL